MTEQFQQFIKETSVHQLRNPRTVQWHRESFAWLDNPEPTQDELKSLVIRTRDAESSLRVAITALGPQCC